eukprot:jgi/Orpsp1_1/1189062/evm.model.d7180000069178.1
MRSAQLLYRNCKGSLVCPVQDELKSHAHYLKSFLDSLVASTPKWYGKDKKVRTPS